jgi:hypothetical protein
VNASFVASLDEELDIGVHEGHGHRNIAAIRENKLRVIAEFLDKTEDVVLVHQCLIHGEGGGESYPSTAVQSRRMISQFINEFVHLKGGRDRLNETSPANRPTRHTDPILRNTENIIPKAGFEMTFHLGEVKVWACAGLDQFMGIVEEIETEIEDAAGDRLTINDKVFLIEMPTSRASPISLMRLCR